MNMNIVILGGNLTRDINLRYTPAGTAVADFVIANNRRYKIGEDLKDEANFIGCTAFGKTAETLETYFKKGSSVLVEGRLKTERWEKAGVKNQKTKLIVEKFHFCGEKLSE